MLDRLDGAAVLYGIRLTPLNAPEDVPVEALNQLLPDLDIKQTIPEYHFAYGFDREWNSGADVMRRSDSRGPVIVLVSDPI